MNKRVLFDILGWGIILWLIGYVLGFVFFMFLPQNLIGWVIMPIGVFITLFVLFKKIKSESLTYYLALAVAWTAIAATFDYFFLVKLLAPADYYKIDVYVYYGLTFILPVATGFIKNAKHKEKS